jgi:chaperonin cofactor prefoldin
MYEVLQSGKEPDRSIAADLATKCAKAENRINTLGRQIGRLDSQLRKMEE